MKTNCLMQVYFLTFSRWFMYSAMTFDVLRVGIVFQAGSLHPGIIETPIGQDHLHPPFFTIVQLR